MTRETVIRGLLLLTSIILTFSALVLALPSDTPMLNPQGTASVTQAPAVRITLASPQKPSPQPKPEPEPKPAQEPEVARETPETEPSATAASAQEATENQAEKENLNQQVQLNAGQSSEVDSYLTKLSRHLGRFYEYPRRARRLGQQGSPVVIFEFSRDGTLVRHSLGSSSDHSLLDEAALAMLKAAEPLPRVPDFMEGETFTYALPVRFSLR